MPYLIEYDEGGARILFGDGGTGHFSGRALSMNGSYIECAVFRDNFGYGWLMSCEALWPFRRFSVVGATVEQAVRSTIESISEDLPSLDAIGHWL